MWAEICVRYEALRNHVRSRGRAERNRCKDLARLWDYRFTQCNSSTYAVQLEAQVIYCAWYKITITISNIEHQHEGTFSILLDMLDLPHFTTWDRTWLRSFKRREGCCCPTFLEQIMQKNNQCMRDLIIYPTAVCHVTLKGSRWTGRFLWFLWAKPHSFRKSAHLQNTFWFHVKAF